MASLISFREKLSGLSKQLKTPPSSLDPLSSSDIDILADCLVPSSSRKLLKDNTRGPLRSRDDSEAAESITLGYETASNPVDGEDDADPSNFRSEAFLILSHSLRPESRSSREVLQEIVEYVENQLGSADPLGILRGVYLLDTAVQLGSGYISERLITGGNAARGGQPSGEARIDALGDGDALWNALLDLAQGKRSGTSDRPTIFLIQLGIVEFLNSASSQSNALRNEIRSRSAEWLQRLVQEASRTEEAQGALECRWSSVVKHITAIGAVTLAKLSLGQDSSQQIKETKSPSRNLELAELFSKIVLEDSNSQNGSGPVATESGSSSSLASAIEGLACVSSSNAIKSRLCADRSMLKRLFSLCRDLSTSSSSNALHGSGLSPAYGLSERALREADQGVDHRQDFRALAYGLATIIYNLVQRPPRLTEQQLQVEKLRRMAAAGASPSNTGKTMGQSLAEASAGVANAGSGTETEESIKIRISLVMDEGLSQALSGLAKFNSIRLKECLGQITLEVVTVKDHRIRFLAQGGAKLVRELAQSLVTQQHAGSVINESSSVNARPALQAFAKIIINHPPPVIFGPDPASTSIDAIRPLAVLLIDSSSDTLQQFEALMALTNLASIDGRVAERIVTWSGGAIVTKAENEMLSSQMMVRRAAVELVCNLMSCEKGFVRYSGEQLDVSQVRDAKGDFNQGPTKEPDAAIAAGGSQAQAKSRLHILLALTDVEDLPTSLAAGGALANLTQSPTACSLVLSLGEKADGEKAFGILKHMLEPRLLQAHAQGDSETQTDRSGTAIEAVDFGLVHRCCVILLNLCDSIHSLPSGKGKEMYEETLQRSGVEYALMDVLKDAMNGQTNKTRGPAPREALEIVVECIKKIRDP